MTNANHDESLRNSFDSILAKIDALTLAVKTIIEKSPSSEHLAGAIYQRLTHFQNAALFSDQASEAYRTSFDVKAEEFEPTRVLRRAGR
ncbi:hypothetical protein [Burkholderia stagnalis]|uniref:hypothetical protein n=1 Tax=Burkholderia stagnalis TaxID=1503054 RepID=UPI00075FD04E|nr:hypothetical protein [Burkholderia stagnalis]KWN77086.1 hypothetical protein WT90_06905 [Burkholderia stagnalis]